MESLDVLEIIEMMEDVIEKAISVPFSGKSLVDKDELVDLLQEIRLHLPEDFKQAKWVKEERHRILDEANKEATAILNNAEEQANAMVESHEIVKKAYAQANEITANAQKNAIEIRNGTLKYADDVMSSLEARIEKMLHMVHENRRELKK